MSLPRLTLRNSALQYADALGATRWDRTAGGEVDLRISSVFDRVWRRILNHNQFYRTGLRTPTSDATTGRFQISDLSVPPTGDDAQRFYRILTVIVGGVKYAGPVNLTDYALSALSQPTTSKVWYQEGTSLNILPQQLGVVADAIWVNWIPQRPSALSDDTKAVDFPEGYDEVLIVLAAARLLMKGGAETRASLELKEEIRDDYEDMLQDIARLSTAPQQMAYNDDAQSWGG